jgi:hypothetical protein
MSRSRHITHNIYMALCLAKGTNLRSRYDRLHILSWIITVHAQTNINHCQQASQDEEMWLRGTSLYGVCFQSGRETGEERVISTLKINGFMSGNYSSFRVVKQIDRKNEGRLCCRQVIVSWYVDSIERRYRYFSNDWFWLVTFAQESNIRLLLCFRFFSIGNYHTKC